MITIRLFFISPSLKHFHHDEKKTQIRTHGVNSWCNKWRSHSQCNSTKSPSNHRAIRRTYQIIGKCGLYSDAFWQDRALQVIQDDSKGIYLPGNDKVHTFGIFPRSRCESGTHVVETKFAFAVDQTTLRKSSLTYFSFAILSNSRQIATFLVKSSIAHGRPGHDKKSIQERLWRAHW